MWCSILLAGCFPANRCGEGTKPVDGVCVAVEDTAGDSAVDSATGETAEETGGDSGGTNGGDSGGTNGGDSGGTNGGDSGGTNGGDSGGTNGGDSGGTNGGDSGGTNGGDSGGSDLDTDGYAAPDDCDDDDPAIHPGADDRADGLDNDCDGYADEWEVCDSGGDYTEIQPALDAARDGQVILVCAGTYRENLDFGGVDAQLVSHDGPDVTYLDGGHSYTVVTFRGGESRDALLDGFTIENGEGEDVGTDTGDYTGGGVYVRGASPTIRGNVFRRNEALVGAGFLIYGLGTNPSFVQNVFEDNAATSIGGAGVFYEGTGGVFDNNLVTTNTSSYWTGGVFVAQSAELELLNNTFAANSADSGEPMGVNLTLYDVSRATIENNIFANGFGGAGLGASGGATTTRCRYNAYFGNSGGDISNTSTCDSATNVTRDPLFTSESDGDWTLQAGSPCIDAGDSDSAYDDVDGTRNDMGAWGGPLGVWP